MEQPCLIKITTGLTISAMLKLKPPDSFHGIRKFKPNLTRMRIIWIFPIYLFLFCLNITAFSQGSGEEIFKSTCSSCHTINGGRLVGPDLSGVYNIRGNEWLIGFIRSSQKLIKSGDSAAIAIYEEYNKIPMPDNNLSDAEIVSIIDFIKLSDENSASAARGPGMIDSLATAGTGTIEVPDSLDETYDFKTISEGRELFNGYTRFVNGAPSCIACHNIQDQSIIGGGNLAIDLTGSYTKLGPAGIKAILKNPPFPVMKTSMLNHELTEDEIQKLLALLKTVGEQDHGDKSPGYAVMFLLTMGLSCALLLLVHIYIFYDNRKIT
jgi:mono/diheme cytochrome c family protein